MRSSAFSPSPAYCCVACSIDNSKQYDPVHELKMSLDRYCYSPLSGPRQIRLVKLRCASSRDDPDLSVELATASLDTPPEYFALSYAWGDPLPKTDINCSGSRIAISANLHSALRHLRPNTPGEVPYIWVDALCINQEDIPERNAQVRIMSDIYAMATKTVIWLGEGDEYTTRAFHWLRRFRGVFEANEYVRPILNPAGGTRSLGADEQWEIVCRFDSDHNREAKNILQTAFDDLANLETVFQDIRMMLRRPWFARKWVLQEVCKSKGKYFVAGYDGVTWLALNRWFLFLEINQYAKSFFFSAFPRDTGRNNFQNYRGISWLARTWSHNAPLVYLLSSTLTLQCSDPRDHIFALASIASDFGTFERLLDYGLGVEELSDRLTRACMVRPADLVILWSILSFIPLERRLRKSWVLNLEDMDSLAIETRHTISQPWNGEAYATAHTELNASPDGDILRIKGRILDVIEQVARNMSAPTEPKQLSDFAANDQFDILERIAFQDRWIEECYEIAGKAQTDPNTVFSALFAEETMPDFEKENIPEMRSDFPSYRRDLKKALVERNRDSAEKLLGYRDVRPGYRDINKNLKLMSKRCFGRTRSAAVGWMPKGAQRGDCICIFDGMGTPYAIRRKNSAAGNYALVGECFISGLEACQTAEMPGRESVIINLE